jgi:MFS family permease
LLLTLGTSAEEQKLPLLPLALTGLTMSVASPNVIATVQDVTEPEVRGTAQAMMSFADNFGSALAPWLAGLIAVAHSLHLAILVLCISTWLLCALLFGVTALLVPRDVERLREAMRARAEMEQAVP